MFSIELVEKTNVELRQASHARVGGATRFYTSMFDIMFYTSIFYNMFYTSMFDIMFYTSINLYLQNKQSHISLPGFTCTCRRGYAGDGRTQCERTCNVTCVHGACSGQPRYVCECSLGWTGEQVFDNSMSMYELNYIILIFFEESKKK